MRPNYPGLTEERAIREMVRREMEYESRDRVFGPILTVLFIVLITAVNNLLNYRLVKNIVRPLQPLSEGVRQIHDNNLAFRINYQNDDEYRPICEAFNEMAARLEASAARKQNRLRDKIEKNPANPLHIQTIWGAGYRFMA
jgi:nitrate/nitrite-specific signal transduction histidine kinase